MYKLLVCYCLLLISSVPLRANSSLANALFQVPASLTTVITDIKPHTICAGYQGTIDVTWTATDNGLQAQQYTIAVYPDNATTTNSAAVRTITNQGQYTSSTGTLKAFKATTTQLNSLPAGKYKLAVLHASIPTTASFSNEFLVAAPATALISDGTAIINAGDRATVRLTLGGTGPWSYSYDDPKNGRQYITNSTSSAVLLELYPNSDYLFSSSRLIGFSGYCGAGTVSGSSQIRVSQLGLTLNSVSQPNACPGSTITAYFTVSGTVSSGTRYKLQLSDINGSFANPRELASGSSSPLVAQTPVNDGPGSGYKLRIISEGTVLTSNTFDITFTRPAPPIVTDYSFCLGTTPAAPTAIGSNLQWFSNDGSTTTYGSTAPTPPSNQSSSYRVSQTINGCPSSTAVINVVAKSKSPLPIVNSPVIFCQNQLATTLNAQGNNLLWFNPSGVALGANSPVPSTSTIGSQQYTVSQDNNGCRSDPAIIVVMTTPPPAVPTISNPTAVCQFAQASNTTLSAAVLGQNLRWYDADQGGPFSTEAPSPRTSKDGTERYYVSQVINGCESNRVRLEQTVVKAPDLPQVSTNPILYCLNDLPRSLTAAGTSLRWYNQATGGSYTNSAPIPSTDRINDQLFYVSQVVGFNNCESQRLIITVRTLSQPAPPQVTSLQFLCQNAFTTALKATGDGLQWSGPGINGTSNSAPVPPTSVPATLTYQVSQKIGNCVSTPSTIQVTVRPQPTAPSVVTPLKLCQGGSTQILQASGENLRWYTTPTATEVARNEISFSPTSPGTYTYYARQSVNGCESPSSRLDVSVSAPVRAILSGDSVVALYDSTAIRVRFVGDAPYALTLWNGKTITTTENPLVVWVKPTPTNNVFKLQSISNDCGIGNPGNSYRLYVLSPLGTDDNIPVTPLQLTTFPNPSNGPLSISWSAPDKQPVTMKILDINGLSVWECQREGTSTIQKEVISIERWAAGTYIVVLSTNSVNRLYQRILLIR